MINQALFGYDHGHRLLAASDELAAGDLDVLVALSDVEVREGRRLTGLVLPVSGRFALVATWQAREADRPGAVWAHVLLVDRDQMSEVDPEALVAALEPPRGTEIERYRQPIDVVQPAPGFEGSPSYRDVLEVARGLYASKAREVWIRDVAAAEAAIVALWTAQWPELRAAFSFAIRSSARRMPTSFDVLVLIEDAPKRHRLPAADTWLETLAEELTGQTSAALVKWINEFGRFEPPRVGSVRALGRLWMAMQHGEVGELAAKLCERYPEREAGTAIKMALFGVGDDWWAASDVARLREILSAETDSWDVGLLRVESRVASATEAGEWPELVRSLSLHATAETRDALVAGLAVSPEPEMVSALAHQDVLLAGELLAVTDLAESSDVWRRLSSRDVVVLLRTLRVAARPEELAGVVEAGHLSSVLEVAGVRRTLKALKHVGPSTFVQVARDKGARELLRGAEPSEILDLAAAGAAVSTEVRLTALEELRGKPDERWLAAAVETLSTDPDALDVVFGPLHAAVVDGRLGSKERKQLEQTLPAGRDTAQRLRALLLQRARKERWGRARLAAAVRGAGPEAARLLQELEPKDPLRKFVKWVFGKAGVHL